MERQISGRPVSKIMKPDHDQFSVSPALVDQQIEQKAAGSSVPVDEGMRVGDRHKRHRREKERRPLGRAKILVEAPYPAMQRARPREENPDSLAIRIGGHWNTTNSLASTDKMRRHVFQQRKEGVSIELTESSCQTRRKQRKRIILYRAAASASRKGPAGGCQRMRKERFRRADAGPPRLLSQFMPRLLRLQNRESHVFGEMLPSRKWKIPPLPKLRAH